MTRHLPALVTCVLFVGCSEDASQKPKLARPVTVLTLTDSSPPPSRLIPGVVRPYRQTQVPFEVTGRVQWLIGVGDDVTGERLNLAGGATERGTILARLDPAPFDRAVAQAEQRLTSAKKQLEAQKVQLETVLPARLTSAKTRVASARLNAESAKNDLKALDSAVSLAKTTVERNRELLPTGAVSDIAVRQSENDLQAARARLAQGQTLVTTREQDLDAAIAAVSELDGTILLQRSNNEAQDARIKELHEAVLDAKSQRDDCVLRAPFPGRVTSLHVGEGSFIQAGAPIVTLTMMNPIEAFISVSAEVEERMIVGSDAMIYPTHGGEVDYDKGVRATLYQKSGVANAQTRTFEIGLIAPNRRQFVRRDRPDLPRVRYVIPVFDNPLDMPGMDGLYTTSDSVNQQGDTPWVLKVRGLEQGARNAQTLGKVLTAERVPVQLGERTIEVASFSLVSLRNAAGLKPGDLLVPEPDAKFEEGFLIDDNRWLLRPGDVVQVAADHRELPKGFYVPVQAVRERNGETSVFVVDAQNSVRAIAVKVAESSGELRRIISDELQPGTKVVHKGTHFLRTGDLVTFAGAGGQQ